MKKRLLLVLLMIVVASFAGCNSEKEIALDEAGEEKELIVIRDKMFIAQCNDIYYNPDDYMDKIIRYEGIYEEHEDPATGNVYAYVVRYGPGCCLDDDMAGFEILYDGEAPEMNDWVEITGTLEIIEEVYLAIRVSDIKVLDERGAEYVLD